MAHLNEEGEDEEEQPLKCQVEEDVTNARKRELKDAVNVLINKSDLN